MNSDAQITPTTSQESRVVLRGGRLIAARIVWIFVTLLYVGLMLYAAPQFFQQAMSSPPPPLIESWTSDEVLYALAEAGIPTSMYAAFALFDVVFFLTSAGIGLFIFLRKSDEPIGLLASYVLIGFGVIFSDAFQSLPSINPELAPLIAILGNGFVIGFILFLLVFPDGKIEPPWMRAGALFVILYGVASMIWPESFSTEWDEGIGGIFTFVIFGLPSFSLVYRFFKKRTDVFRQQIKWLVLSVTSIFFVFMVIYGMGFLIPSFTEPGGPQIITHLVMLIIMVIPVYMLPISVAIAITRYRLWDIDIVINRSIVYASVTVAMGVVFLAGFFGIREVLHATLGGEQPLYPAILSAGIVMALISPTSRQLRRFVDQRFYGIDLDYGDAAKQEEALRKSREEEEPTSTFGKYKALGLIGRGGMGEVYKSEDPETGQSVAIKTLYIRGEGDAEELVKRFHREAQAIEGLEHQNIVKLLDYGEQDDIPYMVMEFIEGEALSQRIRADGRLPLDKTVQILDGVASALDYAHKQGLVHRDIKPSNVIVEQMDGKPSRAVLMDFGIARMVSAMTALTGTGGMVGTLDYISPEQIQGAHQVDGRADVYSLGVMAYQMVTGELPFRHRNPGALIMAHLSTPPPDARDVVKDLPRAAAKAIQRAMAKEAGARFETAGAFVRAMRD